MKTVTVPLDSQKLASASSSLRPGLRFSLRWLLVAMAFLAVVMSHLNTPHKLQRADGLIVHQQDELQRLRSELGILEITDATKARVLFVRQTADKAWRWRA